MSVPGILISILWYPQAAGLLTLGSIVALGTVPIGGPRLGLAASGLLLLVTPLAVVAGEVPLTGAALIALLCLGAGVSAHWGLHKAMRFFPEIMAYLVINPPSVTGTPPDRTSTSYLVATMALVAGGCLWSTIVLGVLSRGRAMPQLQLAARADTTSYTIVITVLCSVCTFAVMTWGPGTEGAWLILTLLMVADLDPARSMSRSLNRVVGTIIGATLAVGISAVAVTAGAQYLAGLVTLLITMVILGGPRYWLFVMFLTPTVILLSVSSNTVQLGELRIAYTVIGAALVMCAAAAVLAYQHLRPTGHLANDQVNQGQQA